MKYKVGDTPRVRSWESMEKQYGKNTLGYIEHNGLSFNSNMSVNCGKRIKIERVSNDQYYSVGWTWDDWMFEDKPSTIFDVQYLDEVKDPNGDKRIVLGRLNDLVWIESKYGGAVKLVYTVQELKESGWTLWQEEIKEEITEITAEEAINELAKTRGVSPESLRIKK